MEIWELSSFTFHIYQVIPARSDDKRATYKTQGLLITELRGEARNAHAEPSQIRLARQAWTRLAHRILRAGG